MNDELGRLEGVTVDVAPGLVADRGVGLPVERADVAELAAFDVEDGAVILHGVVLVIDDAGVAGVLEFVVVIERGETR